MGMQQEQYNELNERSAELLERNALTLEAALAAKQKVTSVLEAMKSEDKILMLTEEEERMLRAFRAFQSGCKPGAVFKWQTRPAEPGVVLAQDTGLIRDPQEVG